MMTGAVQSVFIQLRRPTERDEGQVSEGFYILEGETLVMTYRDGTPVEGFRHALQPDDVPQAIAMVMARKIRRQMGQSDFNRAVRYPETGIA